MNRTKVGKSRFKGVWYVSRKNKLKRPWIAQISVNGQRIYLGYFKTAKEAYAAYCKAAVKHFGKVLSKRK